MYLFLQITPPFQELQALFHLIRLWDSLKPPKTARDCFNKHIRLQPRDNDKSRSISDSQRISLSNGYGVNNYTRCISCTIICMHQDSEHSIRDLCLKASWKIDRPRLSIESRNTWSYISLDDTSQPITTIILTPDLNTRKRTIENNASF